MGTGKTVSADTRIGTLGTCDTTELEQAWVVQQTVPLGERMKGMPVLHICRDSQCPLPSAMRAVSTRPRQPAREK